MKLDLLDNIPKLNLIEKDTLEVIDDSVLFSLSSDKDARHNEFLLNIKERIEKIMFGHVFSDGFEVSIVDFKTKFNIYNENNSCSKEWLVEFIIDAKSHKKKAKGISITKTGCRLWYSKHTEFGKPVLHLKLSNGILEKDNLKKEPVFYMINDEKHSTNSKDIANLMMKLILSKVFSKGKMAEYRSNIIDETNWLLKEYLK